MENGTFEYCSQCKNKSNNCCNSFDTIDNPLITQEEYQKIYEHYNKRKFCLNTISSLYSLNTQKNKCIFFNNNKCDIYDIRPIDCRLFPFDIINKSNCFYLILYKKPCENFIYNNNFIVNNIENIDKLVEKIRPYLKEYTDYNLNKKLRNKEYEIIKQL